MAYTIDNLPANASASEMEEAIKKHEAEQANTQVVEETVEEKKETVEEQPPVVEETAPEAIEKEVVEEKPEYDYKKGYEGLRAWQTKQAQELADIKRSLDGIFQTSQKKQPENQQMTQEQFDDWYSRDPGSASRWLAQHTAESSVQPVAQEVQGIKKVLNSFLAQSTISNFGTRYDDFNSLKGEIGEEVSKYPEQLQNDPKYYEQILESSYWAVKGRKSKVAEDRAREMGKKEAINKAQAKKAAAVEGSGKVSAVESLNTSGMNSNELFEYLKAKGVVRDQY